MGIYFLDVEFTNGNFYMADIIEIALLADDTNHVFHQYIQIHYALPHRIEEMLDITNDILASRGCTFTNAMTGFLDFIRAEQMHSTTQAILIAHGGYYHDFPILLKNCIKHDFKDINLLRECLFVDSMNIFKDAGFPRPGLDTLSQLAHVQRYGHSALKDVYLLRDVAHYFPNVLLDHPYSYTYIDIRKLLRDKLPVSIHQLYTKARQCISYTELYDWLSVYSIKKTALHGYNVLMHIAYHSFNDRYLFCCT